LTPVTPSVRSNSHSPNKTQADSTQLALCWPIGRDVCPAFRQRSANVSYLAGKPVISVMSPTLSPAVANSWANVGLMLGRCWANYILRNVYPHTFSTIDKGLNRNDLLARRQLFLE